MFGDISQEQAEHALYAMLFVSDEPASTITLADALECDPVEVERACRRLQKRLADEDAGVQLREAAGGWQLRTHPAYHELLEHYVLSWDTHRLSQAALEALAVIAYTQPVTRGGVASVRGVNSDSAIGSLVEKGYVREAGVSDAPGNPILYATTRSFLDRFGLRSTKDLPDLASFAPDATTRAYIEERLSATSPVPAAAAQHGLEDGGGRSTTDDQGVASTDEDGSETPDVPPQALEALRQASLDALASASGVTEKVDFDEVRFDDGLDDDGGADFDEDGPQAPESGPTPETPSDASPDGDAADGLGTGRGAAPDDGDEGR